MIADKIVTRQRRTKISQGEITPLAINAFETEKRREINGVISEFIVEMRLEIVSEIRSSSLFWLSVVSHVLF